MLAPFGITFGEAPPTTFQRLNESYAFSDSAPSPHPKFASYSCLFDAEIGVAKVVAESAPFENDTFGEEMRAAFAAIEQQLSNKYGTPERYDYLKVGSIWDGPHEWANSIMYRERMYACFWNSTTSTKLPDELDCIGLQLGPSESGGVKLTISYEGKLWDTVLARIQSKQADVL